jgi:hypothetical protein
MNLAPKTVTSVSPEKLKVSVFLTNHYQLKGEVFLNSGDRCQLSDLLNKSQFFLLYIPHLEVSQHGFSS